MTSPRRCPNRRPARASGLRRRDAPRARSGAARRSARRIFARADGRRARCASPCASRRGRCRAPSRRRWCRVPLRPEPPKAAAARSRARTACRRDAVGGVRADKNLAEMAQRLEAALRRPGANARGEPSAAVDRVGAPPVAPDAPPPRPAARPAAPEPAAAAESESKPSADTPKTQFKNLEDEMASLLGRPKTPS